MGTCLSKKSTTSSPATTLPHLPQKEVKTLTEDPSPQIQIGHESLRKKSVFLIKHRNSHEADRTESPKLGRHVITQHEPAQWRRLSRNSSTSRAKNRSLDLDNNQTLICNKGDYNEDGLAEGSDDMAVANRKSRAKKRSFDFDDQTLINNKGKEIENGDNYEDEPNDGNNDMSLADRISRHRRSRSSSSAGRRRSPRVSRSPSRRSDSPVSASSNISANNNTNISTNKPSKMVSVPASEHTINRISVRRNVGDPSVMGRSPAKQGLSLSRSGSRRAEYSPYRRNALGDIDQNCSGNDAIVPYEKTNGESLKRNNVITQVPYSGPLSSIHTDEYQMYHKAEGLEQIAANIAVGTQGSRVENHRKEPSSYTALLLKDIQNFHQKNTTPSISLPPCVGKAQSIVDAVADLNSGTKSYFYAPLSTHNRKVITPVPFNRAHGEYSCHVSGDLADPSFHKYVTVKRGTMDVEEDDDEEESSGSNSFVSGNQHWVSSSSWEPNSSDSTGYYSSSRSNAREDKNISMGPKGNAHSFSESDQQRSGIGRYRVGSSRS